jgi:5-oxoprolinase (ATP-hydrolysing) subunit A
LHDAYLGDAGLSRQQAKFLARSIDINADLGEHDGEGYSADALLLDIVSSASIACGKHAGSLEVMRRTVAMAYERGVRIGAHPGYPDREGFGRREIGLSLEKILDSFEVQIQNLQACCDAEGALLRYVKPHGALYNRAVRDLELAKLLAGSVVRLDSSLIMLALAGSALEAEARAHGLRSVSEAFIDRAYLSDGTLVPRDREGAVIENPEAAAGRAVNLATGESLETIDGGVISLQAQSLCVHGDSRNALETVRLTRSRLEAANFTIAPFAT